MTSGAEQIFRASALQRAASPDELDHLVAITKPADWILAAVVTVALLAAIVWGIYGRIPSRVSGQGILVGSGRVVDAVSAAEGRLASLGVAVGDHVERGQVIAQISQTEIEQKYGNAAETYKERQREHDDMAAKVEAELAVKASNFEKLEAAFNKVIEATGQRVQSLDIDVKNLEQLMAFSVSDDHARQEQVWELVRTHHNQSPWFIRARLTEAAVAVTDPRVRFIGLDAYVAAGGCVMRDLFEEDRGGWLQDTALLDRLVLEKLSAEADRIRAEGWKWVEVAVDLKYGFADGMRAIEAVHTPPNEENLAEVAKLQAEAEALEAEWGNADEIPDTVDARINALDEQIATLAGGSWAYDPTEMAIAGVFVSFDRSGSFEIEAGWVRAEDEPLQSHEDEDQPEEASGGEAVQREGDGPANPDVSVGDQGPGDEEDEGLKPLPDRLISELTADRTLALQDAIAGDPRIAFAAVLHNFVLSTFYLGRSESCLEISLSRVGFALQPPGMKHSPAALAIEARHAKWKDRLPRSDKALWDALLQLDGSEQAELFAHCTAYSVNAVFEAVRFDNGRISPHTIERRLAHGNVLAQAVGLDLVAAGWHPTAENYFGKVTKARIVEAVTEGKGSEAAARIEHLKKPDMAREAEQLMADAGWLPEPIRMPPLASQPELAAAPEPVDLAAFRDAPGDTAGALGIAAE